MTSSSRRRLLRCLTNPREGSELCLPMRPTALESLYRDLEVKYGYQERTLPANYIIRPLSLEDAEEVAALEQECFPPEEAASLDKISYRLREAPEFSAGVFKCEYNWDESLDEDVVGVSSAKASLVKETLVCHVHATKVDSINGMDKGMTLDGHNETGRVIGIHAVATKTDQRGQGLAHILLKDYVQRMFTMYTAEGMALLAHKELIPFYEKIGFENKGESKSSFGNGGWYDMYLAFDAYDDEA